VNSSLSDMSVIVLSNRLKTSKAGKDPSQAQRSLEQSAREPRALSSSKGK